VSPFPVDPPRSSGPMQLVLSSYPSRDAAVRAVEGVLGGRLVACATLLPVESRYWWRGQLKSATEVLVVFKTVPKRVGALFRYLRETHPYEVPEIVQLDVPRVEPGYLDWLVATLDPVAPPRPSRKRARRPEARRVPATAAPRRTRAPPRRR
jgi:periplasmic divalent cation tolerance protein